MSDQPSPPSERPDRQPDGRPADDTGALDIGSTQEVPASSDAGWLDEMSSRQEGGTSSADPTDRPPSAESAGAPALPPPSGPPQPAHLAPAAPGPQAVGGVAPSTSAGGEQPIPGPWASAVAASGSRRRGPWIWAAAVVLLCLVSGVIGGVAGQLLTDRLHVGGADLPQPGPGVTARPAGSVAHIAATALPSVVTIKVQKGGDSGTGSGFVIDTKGHILTNNHVVSVAAGGGKIEVVLSNGETEEATVVGRDASYDLAVVKIRRTDLKPLVLGESDKVVVGDQVIAVGAPLGLDQTVTTGIVSALNRPVSPGEEGDAAYMNAIQTDAAINPGNSGGPLLDMNGQVIGVNSAIARVPGTSGSTGGNIGLGFAIPSDQARRTAEQLISTGKSTHPVIGVLLDRTYTGEGAQVLDEARAVTPGGPAAQAGIKPGDIIVGFEGKRVRSPDALIVAIRARAVGDTVRLTVERGGKRIDLKMVLEADPNS